MLLKNIDNCSIEYVIKLYSGSTIGLIIVISDNGNTIILTEGTNNKLYIILNKNA